MLNAGPFEYDEHKSENNFSKHGLRLSDFRSFDEAPIVVADERADYGESRYRAFGRIDGLGYMIAFVVRASAIRLISYRRCHEKEIFHHERG